MTRVIERWARYELIKRIIDAKNLPPAERDKAILEALRKLGL